MTYVPVWPYIFTSPSKYIRKYYLFYVLCFRYEQKKMFSMSGFLWFCKTIGKVWWQFQLCEPSELHWGGRGVKPGLKNQFTANFNENRIWKLLLKSDVREYRFRWNSNQRSDGRRIEGETPYPAISKNTVPPHSQDTTKTPSSQRVQRVRCGCISVQFANEAKNENKRATFGWRRRVFLPPPRRRRTIVFHGVFSKGDTNDYAAAAVPFRRTPHATGLRLPVSTSRFRRAGVVGGGMVLRRCARGIRGWRGGSMRNAVALLDKKGPPPPPPPPGYRPNIVLFFRIDTCRAFSSYSVFPRLYVITLWWRCVCTRWRTHMRRVNIIRNYPRVIFRRK